MIIIRMNGILFFKYQRVLLPLQRIEKKRQALLELTQEKSSGQRLGSANGEASTSSSKSNSSSLKGGECRWTAIKLGEHVFFLSRSKMLIQALLFLYEYRLEKYY